MEPVSYSGKKAFYIPSAACQALKFRFWSSEIHRLKGMDEVDDKD
jgi:hypothetical protein